MSQLMLEDDLLEELICYLCNGYLSCGPVLILENGSSVCGRCVAPEGQAQVRNIPYENLAKLMKFPCKNKKYGCTECVTFSSMASQSHEAGCKYRQYVCPIPEPGACDWKGRVCDLLDHCNEIHPESTTNNPVTLEHNITISNIHTLIMSTFELLFLIYTKVCFESGKIYHSVQLLINSNQNSTYTYDLVISNRNGKIYRCNDVIPTGSLENYEIVTNITGLGDILGKLIGTTFRIKVKLDNFYCSTCEKQIEDVMAPEAKQILFCRPCFSGVQACKYEGCYFKDTYNKLLKHEKYYCVAKNGKCILCSDKFSTSTIWHYKQKHSHEINLIGETRYCVYSSTVDIESLIFESDIGIIHCLVTQTHSEIIFEVFTPLTSKELSQYTCKLILLGNNLDLLGDERCELDMLASDVNAYSDWKLTIASCDFGRLYVFDDLSYNVAVSLSM